MRKHIPLLVICLGYLMVIVDATIVNVALPAMGRDLHAGVSDPQWVVDAYTVVFAGLLLSAGSFGDRLGARRIFSIGLGVFTLASAACAASPSAVSLIVARVAQGLGAAMLVPSSLALLRAAYHDSAERARAIGAWGAVAGIGAASGPILGGVLVTLISWRAIFVVNLPLGMLGLILASRHLPAGRGPTPGSLDPAGQALGIVGLAAVTFGLIEGGAAGWTSALAWVPLLTAVSAAALFVSVERRAPQPMLPLTLFSRPTFSGATFVGLAINLGFYGQLFALSRASVNSTGLGVRDDRKTPPATPRARERHRPRPARLPDARLRRAAAQALAPLRDPLRRRVQTGWGWCLARRRATPDDNPGLRSESYG